MRPRKLNSCCFCFKPKTGVIIIGILGIMGAVGILISAPLEYRAACPKSKTVRNNAKVCEEAYNKLGEAVISSVIGFLLMLLMVIGSQRKSPQLMMPMIILEGISIVVLLIATWYLTIYAFIYSTGNGLSIMFLGNLRLAIDIYIWLVIYSRREEIKDEADSDYV